MIHYFVSFSLASAETENADLSLISAFLGALVARGLVHDFRLLRNKAAGTANTFRAVIVFPNGERFTASMREVAEVGVHTGAHGAMIANVRGFSAEVFEEVVCA